MTDALPLLFPVGESRQPGETDAERAFRMASNFACEQQDRQRRRMQQAVATFAPLFDRPCFPIHAAIPIKDIARQIRASELTALRVVAQWGTPPGVKRRGRHAERLPLTITGPIRHGLSAWFEQHREGVAGPLDVTERRYL